MTINEDTGEDVVCPICGVPEYWECGHLVASIDRTFCECQAGALFDQAGKFSSLIESTFIRFLKADEEPVFKNWALEELWEAARDNFVREEDYIEVDKCLLLNFFTEILEDAGAYDLPGSLMDPGGPGMTSSISILFDEKPVDVVEEAFMTLSNNIEGA
jgi:hypothetical protein